MKWFLAGLGLGAIAAILFTPRSGSEMQEVLEEKFDEARRQVEDAPEERYTITEILNESAAADIRKADAANGVVDDTFREAS